MKINIILLIVIWFILNNTANFAQNYRFLPIKNTININKNFGSLGKGLQFEQAEPVKYLPDDIIIDKDRNFIICDKFSKKIIKYDSELNPLQEIQITDDNFGGKYIDRENKNYLVALDFNIDLEIDQENNLYVLISKRGFYYKMLKYDKTGFWNKSFDIGTQLEGIMAQSFYIHNQKIFIITSSGNPFDRQYFKKGNIFVYNTSGIFLGRGDYYLEDNTGNIYKKNNINKKNQLWIDQYSSTNNNQLFFTSSLIITKSLYANLDDNTALPFLGIDNTGKIYFITKNINEIIGKIFDFNRKKVIDISVKKKYKELKNQFLIPHNPFILSPSGEIFMVAISTGTTQNNWFKVNNFKAVKFIIFKIKM